MRLKSLGYTLDAIREALAAVGVVVSKSTVQREASRRHAVQRPTMPSLAAMQLADAAPLSLENSKPVEAGTAPRASTSGHHQSGRDVAAAFVSNRVTNPLLRKDHR